MRWRTCSDAPSGASTWALVRGPAYCGTADKNTGGKREEHVSMAADGNGTTNDGRGDDGTAKALSKAAVARRTVLSGAGVWALAACSTSS